MFTAFKPTRAVTRRRVTRMEPAAKRRCQTMLLLLKRWWARQGLNPPAAGAVPESVWIGLTGLQSYNAKLKSGTIV